MMLAVLNMDSTDTLPGMMASIDLRLLAILDKIGKSVHLCFHFPELHRKLITIHSGWAHGFRGRYVANRNVL